MAEEKEWSVRQWTLWKRMGRDQRFSVSFKRRTGGCQTELSRWRSKWKELLFIQPLGVTWSSSSCRVSRSGGVTEARLLQLHVPRSRQTGGWAGIASRSTTGDTHTQPQSIQDLATALHQLLSPPPTRLGPRAPSSCWGSDQHTHRHFCFSMLVF